MSISKNLLKSSSGFRVHLKVNLFFEWLTVKVPTQNLIEKIIDITLIPKITNDLIKIVLKCVLIRNEINKIMTQAVNENTTLSPFTVLSLYVSFFISVH
jgi:hypothetical protein